MVADEMGVRQFVVHTEHSSIFYMGHDLTAKDLGLSELPEGFEVEKDIFTYDDGITIDIIYHLIADDRISDEEYIWAMMRYQE